MKIYISATQRDLQRHRQAVLTILRRMGHQPMGMEEYVAEGMRPLHRCLEDVAACDAYVGIIGWRYGHVPAEFGAGATASSPPGDTEIGKTSITEFEFRQAVEEEKPVLMFLLDPEAEWPSSQFDAVTGKPEHAEAITRLRQEIGQQYLVSYFRSPEDLASLVSAAVYRLEMSRQIDLDSLRVEPGLNQGMIRHGPLFASTLMEIKKVISGPDEIHALQINIGSGRDWWMTRLYFLSSLAADLTTIEVVVFVGEGEAFIGITDPRILKERLARCYPVPLEKYENALENSGPPFADIPGEVERRARIWTAEIVGEDANPTFVTRRELERWLGPYFITRAVDWEPGDNAALRMQRLIDWPMRFVPVVEKGRFTRVVDKHALTEQVARLFIREQVSRALSTFR